MTNEYDALIDDSAPVQRNEYDDILDQDNADKSTQLKVNMKDAAKQNPDNFAKVYDLSKRTGLPVETVQRNKDVVEADAKFNENDYDKLLNETPGLAEKLANDPHFASMASDELESLSAIEKLNKQYDQQTSLMGWASDRFKEGFLNLHQTVNSLMSQDSIRMGNEAKQFGSVTVGYDPLGLPITVDNPELLSILSAHGEQVAGDLAKSSAETQAELLKIPMRPSTKAMMGAKDFSSSVDYFMLDPLGTIGDIGIPSLVQMAPSLAATIATRNPVVAVTAMGANSYAVETGAGIIDYLNTIGIDTTNQQAIQDALNNPDIFRKAQAYAGIRAAIIGTFDAVSGGVSSKALIPEKIIKNRLGREAASTFIAQPTVQATLGAGGEATAQVATTGKVSSPSDVLAEAIGETFTAPVEAASFAAQRIAGHSVDLAKAEVNKQNFDEQMKISNSLKLKERSIDKFKEYMQTLQEKSGIDGVFIPVEKFNELYQSDQEGPAAVAQRLGFGNQYAEAMATNAEIIVPLDVYASEIAPDHHAQLSDSIKLRYNDQSVQDAQASYDEALSAMQEADTGGNASRDQSFNEVYQDIRGQLTGIANYIGREGDIDADAKILASHYQAQAEDINKAHGTNLTAMDVFRQHAINIQGDMPVTLKGKTVDETDLFLNEYLKAKPITDAQVYGGAKSLVEFLRHNGVRDDGGELAVMDIDKGRKPYQKNIVRRDGRSLDDLATLASESGYFNDAANVEKDSYGRVSINSLLNAVDNELRGSPLYPSGSRNEQLAAKRDAFSQLDEFFGQAGIDPRQLDRDTLKRLLSGNATDKDISSVGMVLEQSSRSNADKNVDKISTSDILNKAKELGASLGVQNDSISGQKILESRLEQWSAGAGNDGLGSIGLVEQEWAEPSRYEVKPGETGFASEEKRGREEQAKLIAAAKEHGFFFGFGHPIFEALDEHENYGGAEHDAYIVGKEPSKLVIRNTVKGGFGSTSSHSPVKYLKRLKDYNNTFPNMQTRMIGVTEDFDGNAVILTAQRFVKGDEFAKQEQLDAAMRKHGWFEVGTNSYKYRHKETGAIIEDVHTGNVLHIEDDLFPIDVVVEKMPEARIGGQQLYQSGKTVDQTKTKAFKKWFGKSKVVDDKGKPLVVYHGTTADFTEFDREKANPESDFGAGFYFTNTVDDVGSNYTGIGPDLEQKIQLTAERIASETDREYDDPDVIAEARQRFMSHEGMTMPVYIKMEKPAVVGGDNETVLEMTQEVDEDEFTGDENGTLVDFIVALRDVAGMYHDGDVEQAISNLLEAASYESIGIESAIETIKETEEFSYFTDDNGELASNEIIRKTLEQTGFDGIIDHSVDKKFGSQRRVGKKMAGMTEETVHYIAFNPEQIKSAIGNSGEFNPDDPNILNQPGTRASVQLASKAYQESLIKLGSASDRSSLLHEGGHVFLENLRFFSNSQYATPRMRDDLQRTMDWFKSDTAYIKNLLKRDQDKNRLTDAEIASITDERIIEQADRQGITIGDDKLENAIARAFHEKFADGWEAYVMEGKAPSLSLQRVFEKFSAWLKHIYRTLRLDNTLNDEMRGVMDRLLATDEEISQARERNAINTDILNTDLMTDEEKAAYIEVANDAQMQEESRLRTRVMGEITRQRKEWWKEERAKLRKEVEADVNKQPRFQVLHYLQHKELLSVGDEYQSFPEGFIPERLSRDALVDMFGEGVLSQLPKPYVYQKTGGVHPDILASEFGFANGREMVQALMEAPNRKQHIEELTDQAMLDRYGDMLNDGSVVDEANAAIHTDERAAVMELELKYLTRKAKNVFGRTPPRAAMQQAARMAIAQKRVRDINPNHYLSAEVREARASGAAMKAKEHDKAALHKRRQMMNHYMYREALAAKDDVEKGVEYQRKFDKKSVREKIGKAGRDYLEQIDGLREQYDFTKSVSLKAIDKRKTLKEWIDSKEEQGIGIDLPAWLVEQANQRHYKDITVDEMRGVIDAMKHIEHKAKRWLDIEINGRKIEFQQWKSDAIVSLHEHNKSKPDRDVETELPIERAKSVFKAFAAELRKIPSLVRQLDGYKDSGIMWEALVLPLNKAADAEAVMQQQALKTMMDLFKPYRKVDMFKKQYDTKTKALGTLSKQGILTLALNWGNAGNRQRIMAGYQITEAQVQNIFKAYMKPEDWHFVQSTWDYINQYWEPTVELDKRTKGIAPPKVEADPVVINGEQVAKGGYYPLASNRDLNNQAYEYSLEDQAKQLLVGKSSAAKTAQGRTQERLENASYKVALDFGVLFKHVNESIHDITHREAAQNVHRIINDKEMAKALTDKLGTEQYREMQKWVVRVAAGDVAAAKGIDSIMAHIRAGTAIAAMGFKLSTAMLQPLGFTQSIVRLGPKWVAYGIKELAVRPLGMNSVVKEVHAKSTFMANRARTMNREINEIRNKFGVASGKLPTPRKLVYQATGKDINDAYFIFITKMQLMVDIPTWMGGYAKAMSEGHSEERAIALADQSVIDAQAGGQMKDLAGIQTGNAMKKLFTVFYSYFSSTYQLTRESIGKTNFKSPASIGLLAVDMALLYTIPALLSDIILGYAPGSDDDDEDFVKWIISSNLNYAGNTIPFLREMTNAATSYFDYSGPAGISLFGDIGKFAKQAEQGELDAAFWKSLDNIGGKIFHYPSSQLNTIVEGLDKLFNGELENPAGVVLPGYQREGR